MTHSCQHHHSHTPSEQNLEARLLRAKTRLEELGEKLTPGRGRALELIYRASSPVKAYDLIENFKNGQSAKPPTIYRALSFLNDFGLIHRLESLNAYVACDHEGHEHTVGFLLCDCCGQCEEFQFEDDHALKHSIGQSGFRVKHFMLEFRGTCKKCQ